MKKSKMICLLLLIALFLTNMISTFAESFDSVSAASKTIDSVGYGVKNLKVKNPFSSCAITSASSVTKGSTITIRFSSSYTKSQKATGKFLHDGWHNSTHTYNSGNPTYIWSIINSKDEVIKSGILSSGNSINFSTSSLGSYTIKCRAVSKCTPSPSSASVGINEWTQTKMPTINFTKTATSKVFKVKKATSTTSTSKSSAQTSTSESEVSHWVKGQVSHTSKWDEKRKEYNKSIDQTKANSTTITLKDYKALKKPRGRYKNIYWAGEKLLLSATADKGATKINVKIVDTTFSTSLSKSSGTWSGSLWSKKIFTHWEDTYPLSIKVKFTAKYDDGKSKSQTVKVIVDQSAYSDLLHRVE